MFCILYDTQYLQTLIRTKSTQFVLGPHSRRKVIQELKVANLRHFNRNKKEYKIGSFVSNEVAKRHYSVKNLVISINVEF